MAVNIEKPSLDDTEAPDTTTGKILSVVRACAYQLNVGRKSNLYDEHDLVQEVWVRLLSDDCNILKKYDAARGASFEYYISMIAKREMNNLLKKETALKRGGQHKAELKENNMDMIVGTEPEPILEARNTIEKLDSWLRKGLSQKGVDVFLSSFQEDEEPTETAARLGITTQMVYNWQHKIRILSRSFEKTAAETCSEKNAKSAP